MSKRFGLSLLVIAAWTSAAFAAPILTVSPDSPPAVSFGSARVLDTTTSSTTTVQFTISNSGTGNFTVSALGFSGAAAGDYSIPSPPTLPATLSAGEQILVTVQFDPSALGTRDASFDITNTLAAKSVAITGSGTSAIIDVSDFDFGTVTDNTTMNASFPISNSGGTPKGPLTVTSATIMNGGGIIAFGTGAGCTAGTTTCTFTQPFQVTSGTINAPIACSPPTASAGTQSATITFASDTDVGGTSVANITCTSGRPVIQIDKTSLAFGNQLVNTSSTGQTVTVTNTGTTNLTYTVTKVPNASQYALSGCFSSCTVPFTPGTNTKTFTVVFTPTAAGALNIDLDVASNDPDHTVPIDIPVTGTGVAPAISTNTPVAFGTVDVGMTSGGHMVTATNSGTADLTITAGTLTAGGLDYTVTSAPPLPIVISPGGSTSWTLTCHPTTFGSRPGTFQIASNAAGAATTNVALTCTGNQGVIATNPTSLAFGGVREGDPAKTLGYHLQNTGNATITGVTAVLDPTTVGYSLDPTTPVPTTLAPGANIPLNVIFAPTTGVDGGPATVTFTGSWGSGPTATMAVMNLTGTGLVAGFALSPAIVDFGDLRFDTTPSKTFCITNTDSADVTIKNNISISPHAGTMTNEFVVGSMKLQTVCGVGGSAVTLPHTLSAGQVIEVTVTADPANRTGAMAADLTVASDLPMNPNRTILLQGNSTSAMLTLTPGSTLDFGPVDLDGGPVSQTLTITNTGDAPLDLSNFTKTASAVYTLTLPTGTTTLQPTEHLDLMVTYHPTIERPPGQFDSMIVTHGIAGVLGAPALEMLTIQGRGITRHIAIPSAPVFPDTFRNPGDKAPVVPVTVQNMGEANLHISAVMASGDPIWTVMESGPSDVGGLASTQFHVKFAPTEARAEPDGQLTIMNNDTGMPMAMVVLHGNGINRNVQLGPNNIEMGYVGVGVPVVKDNVLSIASMDSVNTFRIRSITLDGTDDSIQVVDSPADIDLAPDETKTFSVTFTPAEEKDFEVHASLFLDMDPEAQGTVTITGHAVYVDAHGGGGCSTGGASGAAVVLVVAAFALRRRRAMIVALALIPAAVRADNVDLSVFNPTPATTTDGFQLQSAQVGADGDWVATAVVSLATDPLVLSAFETRNGQQTLINDDHAIQRRLQYEIGGAYAFLDRFEVGLRMPFYTQSGETITDMTNQFGTPPAHGTARGDLTLHGKMRLLKLDSLALGAGVQLTLPTSTDGQYSGVDKPSARAVALATIMPFPRLTLTANAGAVIRAHSQFANLDQGSGATLGAGASYRILDELWLAAELFGDVIPRGSQATGTMTPTTLSPVEWLAGINYRLERRVTIGLAAGRGLTSSFGAPDLRGVFAMTFAPSATDLVPIHPPLPDGDADGDGIPDSKDKCPNEPEDFDMFEDTDGCPDLDNDHDGIPDAQDKCPLDPEDKDGFQDADGCPDPDNDGDGIPDVRDKCPNEPEDKDGFEDFDGCPDPDNDKDGIPDVKDKCPNEPETINGFQDDDGCPDKGDPLVILSPDRLDTLEAIQFAGAKLNRASFNLLGQIGAQLRAHNEIARLRVTVYVNPSRNSDKDQELSDKRAVAIKDWLVQWGVDARRLEVRGFGGDKPLVPPTQKNAQQLNDRVELIILERR
jgi:outer membrane protein OmpA-like peptidoglycan-associated protein